MIGLEQHNYNWLRATRIVTGLPLKE
jgi:hypothetical protein